MAEIKYTTTRIVERTQQASACPRCDSENLRMASDVYGEPSVPWTTEYGETVVPPDETYVAYKVRCNDCGHTTDHAQMTRDKAIELWNGQERWSEVDRMSKDQLKERVRALESRLKKLEE